MYTIKDNVKYEEVIKNSKFIGLLYKTNDNLQDILNKTKELYPDATHYTYAYITKEASKSSDDKEPSGTAGIPIFKALERENLTNIILIVVRYFGGIKLGASGLTRAYANVANKTIKEATLVELIPGINLDIIFNYNETNKIDYLLKDVSILNKTFDDVITYNINIPKGFLKTIEENKITYKIINDNIEIERTI